MSVYGAVGVGSFRVYEGEIEETGTDVKSVLFYVLPTKPYLETP